MDARMIRIGAAGMCALAAACSAERQRGGGTVDSSSSFNGLYVANTDHGTISRVDAEHRAVAAIDVGREPTRVLRVKDRIYVSLRGERAVAVLREIDGGLAFVSKIPTGAEPYGLAATETRLYVAASMSGVVTEFDLDTHAELRSWNVEQEPRWIAAHPSGKALYVASAFGGRFTWIDLPSGRVTSLELPAVEVFDGRDGSLLLSRRLTGDPAVTPDGRLLVLPALYVNNLSVIQEAERSSIDGAAPDRTVDAMDDSEVPNRREPRGGSGYDAQRFNPVAVLVPVHENNGVPEMGEAEPVSLTTFTQDAVNGYPVSTTITSDSEIAFFPIEGAAAVVALNIASETGRIVGVRSTGSASTEPAKIAPVPCAECKDESPPHSGADCAEGRTCEPNVAPPPPDGFRNPPVPFIEFRPLAGIDVPAGPRGVAITKDGKVFVHSAFDRTIASIDLRKVREWLGLEVVEKTLERIFPLPVREETKPDAVAIGNADDPVQVDVGIAPAIEHPLRGENPITIAPEVLSEQLERGRRLFFAANNPLMATIGAGVSCSTCHFEGRNDGLTWHFSLRGSLQTPSLAGQISLTHPMGWAGGQPTIADEAMHTSQRLMGGQGMTMQDAQDIQAFVDSFRRVDNPLRGNVQNELYQQGKAIFERADVNCVSCHYGVAYANNQVYSIFGMERVKTRSLVGIFATAPYFHDGSAPTLRDVLERVRDGRAEMGDTSMLTEQEMQALEFYLRSL